MLVRFSSFSGVACENRPQQSGLMAIIPSAIDDAFVILMEYPRAGLGPQNAKIRGDKTAKAGDRRQFLLTLALRRSPPSISLGFQCQLGSLQAPTRGPDGKRRFAGRND